MGAGLVFIIFQLIFGEGVSASWINKRAAPLPNGEGGVIIQQTWGGGATERSGLIIFRKYLSSNNYFKPVCSQCASKLMCFFFLSFPATSSEPILLMPKVNIPAVANMVISRIIHTAGHVFHAFACREKMGEKRRVCEGPRRAEAKLKGRRETCVFGRP